MRRKLAELAVPPATSPLPGPAQLPFVGSLLHFVRDMPEYSLRLFREYGDLVGFTLGPHRVVLVSRPEWIQDILVTNARNFVKIGGFKKAEVLLGKGLLTSEGTSSCAGV